MAQSNFPALTVQQVQTAYLAFFNRPADSAGLAYWTSDQHKGGLPGMWSSFGLVPEFTATFGNKPATEIVETFYVNMFGRPSDAAGKEYWLAELAAKRVDIGNLAAAFDAGAAPADKTILSGKVVANTATTQAAIDAVLPGTTFLLTTGVDAFLGTAKMDTIQGVVSALSASNSLNSTDVIDGGAGIDTLSVDMQSNFTGFSGTGKLVNVENVTLSNSGPIARNFDATGVTNVAKYSLNSTESSLTLTNLSAAGVTVDVLGQKSGTASIGFTTKAVEGTADSLTLGASALGTVEVKDAAGVVTTADKFVTVTATGIENLVVNATGANFVNLAGAASKSIVALGQGSLKVEAVGAITSFDASALKGSVTANLTGAAAGTLATVAGGEGNDVLTVAIDDLTPTATISGGAGVNTLKVSGLGTVMPTMNRIQTLELNGVTGEVILSGKNVSDLSTLSIKGTAGIGANTVTVSALSTAALTVNSQGAQAGGTVQLTAPTVLTYQTAASAATTTAKGATPDNIQTIINAGEALNATINVGAFTTQSGAITVNKATAIVVNVATGKSADATPVEKTTFDADLNANGAQSVVFTANGILGATGGGKTLTAGAATLLDVTATGGGDYDFATIKAQQVNIKAGAAFDFQDSLFTAAEVVGVTANVGHTNGTGVALGNISNLSLSGGGSATGKESQVTLGNLGSATGITNSIVVTGTGLKGGATVGTIDTKGGNVNLNATEMTGAFVASNVGAGANKVGNVTINSAVLGSTKVGTISTVAGATVQVNATGLLGKDGSGVALTVGATLVATETNKNTGSVAATINGSNKFDVGTLQAKTVTLDVSGYLGGDIKATGANGSLGTITGQTVTVKGTELAINEITVDPHKHADESAATVIVTGGLKDDKLTISSTVAVTNADAIKITFNGGDGANDTIVFAGTATDLTNVGSKLTLSGVEKMTTTKALTIKAADVSGLGTLAVTPTEKFTIKGTDAADTINLTKITGALTVQGGKGNDIISLKADNASVDTILFEATAANNGSDTITGFKSGAASAGGDVFDFNLLSGTGSTGVFTVAATITAGLAGKGTGTAAVVDIAKKISFITDANAATDTIAKVTALITAAGSSAGQYKLANAATTVIFYGKVADGAQTFEIFHATGTTAAATLVKIGVVGVSDGDGLIAANFIG